MERVPSPLERFRRIFFPRNRQRFYWQLDYRRWVSAYRMGQYRNRYQGQRCVIIGNGPSLNNMDLSVLKNETTFALNRGYLLFDRIGASSTFFVCINQLVLEQFGQEMSQLPMPKFISWAGRRAFPFTRNTSFFRTFAQNKFSFEANHLVNEGNTVTFATLQIAYFMGFSKVILIGVDHNFVDKGDPHKTVTTQASDANHFDPNYFGKGIKWQLPDLEGSEKAYRVAKEAYETDGRVVLDATLNGKLQVFPKINLSDALSS